MTGSFPALLIRGGGLVFALPLESVAEVMRPLPIEPLGGMPAFVLGVSIIRGLPTPVADLTGLVGGVSGPPSRFVTVRVNGRVVALAVESVTGTAKLDPEAWQEVPPLLQDARPDLIAALGELDRELLLVLGHARLVPDEVWAAIGSAEDAQ